MNETLFHSRVVLGVFAAAAFTLVALLVIAAPYGRHARKGWGPTIGPRAAWVLMEFPAVFVWIPLYLAGTHRFEVVPLALALVWQSHYVHRTLVYPFRLRGGARMPITVPLMGFAFNLFNAYINARWVSQLGSYPLSWLWDPRFIGGVAIFLAGMRLNRWSDGVLRNLRKPGETGYKIPRGGLYEYVSCPNYLGEALEWFGWAVATWSWPGLAFFAYTVANLLPRALENHRWYREKFADYPASRRALVPFVL